MVSTCCTNICENFLLWSRLISDICHYPLLHSVRCDMGSLSSCFVCLDQSRYS
ncbi:hypothetical protein S83_004641, partial [Arachis hypogaea]